MTFPGWEVTTRHVLASFLLHVRYGVMCLIIHVRAGGGLGQPSSRLGSAWQDAACLGRKSVACKGSKDFVFLYVKKANSDQ